MRMVDAPAPWLQYRETELYVIPSLHHRQAFAQLIYEACRRRPFDTLALELTPSLAHTGALEGIRRLGAAPGLVIDASGETATMPVPVNDHPDCPETVLRPVTRGRLIPVSPCDSLVMALRCPEILAGLRPGWNPEVALIDAEHEPGVRAGSPLWLPDDYEVVVRGLPEVYARLEDQLQLGRIEELDGRREATMAARLSRFLDAGKSVIFVCGAAHWKCIRERLDRGGRAAPAEDEGSAPGRLRFVSIAPEMAWYLGWLDDIPCVTWAFEQHCRSDSPERFDKEAAVHDLMRASVLRAQGVENLPLSVRRLSKMERYVQSLSSSAGRWIPELDGHLVHAAEVCVEERFAGGLKREALDYPAPPPPGISQAQVIPTNGGQAFIIVGREAFLLELPQGEDRGKCRRLRIPVSMGITKTERRQMREDQARYPREWPDEHDLRRLMDARARELAQRRGRELLTRKFAGTLCDGPDWRRTIRSFASHERALYVRQWRQRRPRLGRDPRMVTPVVWVFSEQSPVLQRQATENLLDQERGIWVKSAFLYVAKSETLADGEIRRFQLAALTDLFLSRPKRIGLAWHERVLPEEEMAADIAYLRQVPEEKRCLGFPWADDDLGPFGGVDHAIAVAIKYALDQVIVVSQTAAPLSEGILEFARQRKVELCRVSIDGFEPKRLERFRWVHFVPCPLDEYQPPYPWTRRFIPPI